MIRVIRCEMRYDARCDAVRCDLVGCARYYDARCDEYDAMRDVIPHS